MLIIFSLFTLLLPLVLLLFLALLVVPIVRGAPYMPSYDKTVKKMFALANISPKVKAADLGSGDGKILIALAKEGVEAHGYEINPLLVWWSRKKIQREKLSENAFIHWKSFWRQDFSSFDVIIVFGIPYIMKGLEKKLQKELKPGARVVSNAFTFPHWKYAKKDDGVYLYEKK